MKAVTAITALALSMTLFSLPAAAGSVRMSYADLRAGSIVPSFLQSMWLAPDGVSCDGDVKDEEKELEKIAKEKKKRKEGVPEINAAGATIALALLGGILLLWHERRRSKG